MGEKLTDLFESIQEAKDERQAIQMADGIETTQEELHRCEVQSVIRRYFPKSFDKQSVKEAGDNIAAYCKEVEDRRGKALADKLRADCRKAWAELRAAGGVNK